MQISVNHIQKGGNAVANNIFADDEVLTVKQVADLLQIGEQVIYRMANEGTIPCRKVGSSWRFSKMLIHLWLIGDYDGSLLGDTQLAKTVNKLVENN
jgi:excisionase family DNA binding protein